MNEDRTNDASDRQRTTGRRSFVRATVAGTALVGGSGVVAGKPGRSGNVPGEKGGGNGNGTGGGKGFPPNGTTEYGDSVGLGDGEVRTFTTETPSGNPKYHGVEFDRSALDGLPSADDLGAAIDGETDGYDDKYGEAGEALVVHRRSSLEFFVPFPDAEETPFTFLGLNWNPEGHPGGKGAWSKPHFDVHFHTLETDVIDPIEGPKLPPYDEIPDERIPEGYNRSPPPLADERYITDMGEHLAPGDAPELPDGPDDDADPDAFTNTLIQGFVGVDEGGDDLGDVPRLAFIEPMITREFLRDHSGTENDTVPQPEEYPYDEPTHHPTGYAVRDVPARDAVVVTIREFEAV
ncbi:hypothetical protein ACFPM1_07325 [Halorubrum rubrum]|uniref:DUF5602 domain-containing protein n=1 Tax=Halorubrum rubrum TaxID=1126240 RepID=A0ABD5R183_9EURY|nr:hypothetical protein [Halorubrum rubrum]